MIIRLLLYPQVWILLIVFGILPLGIGTLSILRNREEPLFKVLGWAFLLSSTCFLTTPILNRAFSVGDELQDAIPILELAFVPFSLGLLHLLVGIRSKSKEASWPLGTARPVASNAAKARCLMIFGVLVTVGGLGILFRPRDEEALFARIALSAVAFGLMSAGVNIVRVGRQKMQPLALELLHRDKRAPVLLLRAFRRDGDRIDVPFTWSSINMLSLDYYRKRVKTTPEEQLTKKLESLGPVIALGRQGETLQPLGASRLYVPVNEWQERFQSMAPMALLIVMIVDCSESLRWELAEISRTQSLARLMLVLARREFKFVRHDEDATAWTALCKEFSFLPIISREIVAVTFDASGEARAFRSAAAAITDYAERTGI